MKKTYQQYWNDFLPSTGQSPVDGEEPLIDEFGDSSETADYLIGLVLEGKRRARRADYFWNMNETTIRSRRLEIKKFSSTVTESLPVLLK